MRYQPFPSELFIKNRNKLIAELPPKSMVLISSNDIMPTNADGTMGFKQQTDLFYLSGLDQEETLLLIYPDAPEAHLREIAFVRETSELIAIWEGHKYTKEEAFKASGIKQIYWLEEFWTVLHSIIHYSENIYLNTNENDRFVYEIPYRDLRFINEMKERYPLHHYERSAIIMRDLRAVKSEIEVELTKKACQITRDAFVRVLKFTKPGVKEYEIEAEIIHEFIRQGATGHAYNPIIASGPNATILHYNDNNQVCRDGDVILFDFGAEYANYNADMSRSIPVNGRFTKRQKEVYQAVLRVMRAATKMLVAGTIWNEYHEEVGKLMQSELIGLGLLDKHDVAKQDPAAPLYKKYFMHGTSHHLGIDVHDFASRYKAFEAGNILTCEPGIYIPEEGLGIRLENNILITPNGNIDLMADFPVEAEEIEEIMNA